MKRVLFLCSILFLHSFCFAEEEEFGVSTSSVVASPSYSQAVEVDNFLFVSAQFPIKPSTGLLINGNIQDMTNQILDNMKKLLRSYGYTLKNVVKTEVYLTDIRDYSAMDSAYANAFNFRAPPARDVIQVVNLPFNARIAISCIAR